MAYFDTKKGSLEEAIKAAVKNEKLDAVNKTAVKKKFDDRKDKDIDNDGDVDSSDKFLHKRRKAISKAIKSEENDILHDGIMDKQTKSRLAYSISKLPPHLAKLFDKDGNLKRKAIKSEATGQSIANKMADHYAMKSFASKVSKMKSVTRGDLEKMLPDYVDGADITKLFETEVDLDKVTETLTTDIKDSYEYGTREATTNSLNMTPGQSVDDWDKQVGIMQEKNLSMRETIAKMWGVDEGHNPFKKEEVKTSKKEGKTMTGKSETKVTIGMKDK